MPDRGEWIQLIIVLVFLAVGAGKVILQAILNRSGGGATGWKPPARPRPQQPPAPSDRGRPGGQQAVRPRPIARRPEETFESARAGAHDEPAATEPPPSAAPEPPADERALRDDTFWLPDEHPSQALEDDVETEALEWEDLDEDRTGAGVPAPVPARPPRRAPRRAQEQPAAVHRVEDTALAREAAEERRRLAWRDAVPVVAGDEFGPEIGTRAETQASGARSAGALNRSLRDLLGTDLRRAMIARVVLGPPPSLARRPGRGMRD